MKLWMGNFDTKARTLQETISWFWQIQQFRTQDNPAAIHLECRYRSKHSRSWCLRQHVKDVWKRYRSSLPRSVYLIYEICRFFWEDVV